MIIRAIKLRAITSKGDYGFYFPFARGLTVIRGGNSSGKSTLFNCLLYGLGMEELVGGKGEKVLPYAVKEYFEYNNQQINIVASEVYVELENNTGRIVTLRRAIRDEVRDTKLVEIFEGAHLTTKAERGAATPTYLHDAGGAMKLEGYHRFLENFLGLELPPVAKTGGGECKLYLQTIFAALAVEQKRGWTDYIANIPFYGIRDARTQVTQFLLGLSVFETNVLRNRLDADAVAIDLNWRTFSDELRREVTGMGVVVEGIQGRPGALFDTALVRLVKQIEGASMPISEYVVQLRNEHTALTQQAEGYSRSSGAHILKVLDTMSEELQHLSVLHERATASLTLQRASLLEYEILLMETKEDLERNKTAAKLRDLGAQHAVELAIGQCPTCHQHVDDTLLGGMVSGPQMDLQANIDYLDSQRRMLQRQIAGMQEAVRKSEVDVANLATRVAAKHDYRNALRGDVSNGASESRAIVRRQVQIELEVAAIEKLEIQMTTHLERLKGVAGRLAENQAARKALPKDTYTQSDTARISLFQKMFRANAGSFGYESATISEIKISLDNLTPTLSQLELREIITKVPKADIKADSSASDFVRLIWSYLLALYQTSAQHSTKGNHPGVLLLDEPGQHSMRSSSQHALLQLLSAETNLQSIIAASFDENESVFKEATDGLQYKLIEWDGKLLSPL
ncbi:AAA domain-containing protein [Nitrosospira sp. Nsp2]|uniref:AAA family ATPase n=1 Tax=Nitrosospira sp. Nsp2 TaxID=136548 RepID=UPI000D321B29|nr:AAA family ATPase [Nitrosospira sp. Nsp2]PTR16073.1 AAA domain-containing protein [Nitrosospira sp. Nsp2]